MLQRRYQAIFISIIAALFFSLTFVLNELMATQQSYWLWTACLRYLWTLPLMLLAIPLTHSSWTRLWQALKGHPLSWWLWSQFCFVLFYTPLCLASQFLPGWLVSSTWQLTIIFGVLTTPLTKVPQVEAGQTHYRRAQIPLDALPWMVLILGGVLLTVLDYAKQFHGVAHLGLSLISLMIAAVSYPLGNRQVMAVSPEVNGVEKVLGMLLCSYPTWLLMAGVSAFTVGAPQADTVLNTLLVALSSGVVATILFFQATSMVAAKMADLAKVEATQAMEVVFSVLLSCLFLGHTFPAGWQLIGLSVMIIGIIGISLR